MNEISARIIPALCFSFSDKRYATEKRKMYLQLAGEGEDDKQGEGGGSCWQKELEVEQFPMRT